MLELKHLEKYRTFPDGRRLEVLRGVDMYVPAGTITVLIGPSGCGKSTLLRLINRLEEPDGGHILFKGRDIAGIDPLELRRKVMLVAQKPFMFGGTVLGNLQAPFVLRRQQPPGPEDPLWRRELSRVGLPETLLQSPAATLSVGQQQRVGLARALLCNPEVLLLDEPTSALDRPASDRFAAVLRGLCHAEGMAMLLVTHDVWFAERVAERILFLDKGHILEQGEPGRILSCPQTDALRSFLLKPAQPGGDGA